MIDTRIRSLTHYQNDAFVYSPGFSLCALSYISEPALDDSMLTRYPLRSWKLRHSDWYDMYNSRNYKIDISSPDSDITLLVLAELENLNKTLKIDKPIASRDREIISIAKALAMTDDKEKSKRRELFNSLQTCFIGGK
ncbi:MAG: hypothetical protein HC880_03085 [Bacteroidia bacterium]|nr:hypothetical protein [Bacteroidia bacterium]